MDAPKSGMEMMMTSLLRAAGFDPQVIVKNIEDTIGGFQNMAKQIEMRLNAIHEQQLIQNARLERIELALEIRDQSEEDQHPRRIASGQS